MPVSPEWLQTSSMEATGSGRVALCSAPPHIERRRWNLAVEEETNEQLRGSRHAEGRTMSRRERITPEVMDQYRDSRSCIPANIRHKYGSSVVEQLFTPEQVTNYLNEAEKTTRDIKEYITPNVTTKPWPGHEPKHRIYHDLSQCLRSNLFPGIPINQQSLVHDSFTPDINKRGILERYNNLHWFGRKTDELAIWSQKLMERNAIVKILESQQKSSQNFSMPMRPTFHRLEPPPAPPAKKPKKQKKQTKTKKELPPTETPEPEQQDDFWDFYNTPI